MIPTVEQRAILSSSDQNLYISAAPGSGKSTMLGLICAKLLEDPTNCVMLVTFTNKAAKSIMSKCSAQDQKRILGGTFHGIAYRSMKQAGLDLTICDENKKRLIIKKLFNCRKDKDRFERIYESISLAKSKWPIPTNDLVEAYSQELEKYKLLDFDDIITRFIANCAENQTNEQIRLLPSLTHCLVDELQDTSGPQLEMLKRIQSSTGCKMVGVADDDQSIYEWRGARPKNVRDFISCFGCHTLGMGTNFRSTTRIVSRSRKLIEHNKNRIPKKLRANSTEDGIVKEYPSKSPHSEIDIAVTRCKQNRERCIAILYRNRTFKYHLEFELRKAGLRYRVNDNLDITDRSAIRVAISCLKIASGKYDLYDIEQAAKGLRGLGATSVKSIADATSVGEGRDVREVIKSWQDDAKKSKKVASITSLQDFFNLHNNSSLELLVRHTESLFIRSFDFQEDMREFLLDVSRDYKITKYDIRDLANELGLNGNEEEADDEDAPIELSTVHGYKGLERDVVILPWCHMYLQPMPGKKIDEEAERRLFYVAVTRAKEKVYMSYTGSKPKFIREMGL